MRPRRIDGPALVFGIIFAAIAGWWFVNRSFDLSLPNFGWFVAAGLIGLGGLGIAGALHNARDRDHEPPSR